MLEKTRIAVFGAGGHGKVVIDAIENCHNLQVACIVDDDIGVRGPYFGYSISGGRETLISRRDSIDAVIVAIGDNRARIMVARWLSSQGFATQTIIHPAAVVAASAKIGTGTLVMPGAVINADAHIGANTIINTGAIIEHDCIVGDGVHIAPRAVLCGGVSVGDNALVGAGAVVLPNVTIGSGNLVKAGTVAKKDCESST
jgi:sugar O-acyltransferase (sialic acid O-acetyltransferase NeuD family)